MLTTTNTDQNDHVNVAQALIGALMRRPDALEATLAESGLAPHQIAMWARQAGAADIEKLASWLSVAQQPGHYKPVLEAAAAQLRQDDWPASLAVFRWAYQLWQAAPPHSPNLLRDGLKLLTLWGECLYRSGDLGAAQRRWIAALEMVSDAGDLQRLVRVIEQVTAATSRTALPQTGVETSVYDGVLAAAQRKGLRGSAALWLRRQRLTATARPTAVGEANPAPHTGRVMDGQIVVIADAANLELVCGDQYGYSAKLDYGRLLAQSACQGSLGPRLAFVPEIPETLELREHVAAAGFIVKLVRPKHSHGRIAANADAAIAAAAVRWASAANTGAVELWTGDRDFLDVRQIITETWPAIRVLFRSFEAGTAAGIRQLGDDWQPIGPECLAQ